MFIIFVAGVIVVFVPIGSVLWFIAAKDKYKKAKENTCGDLSKRNVCGGNADDSCRRRAAILDSIFHIVYQQYVERSSRWIII